MQCHVAWYVSARLTAESPTLQMEAAGELPLQAYGPRVHGELAYSLEYEKRGR